MLTDHPKRVGATSYVRFKPQVSFVHRLSALAERVGAKYDFEHWSANAQRFSYIQPSEFRHIYMDHNRVQFQTLTLDTWIERLDEHIDIAKMALDAFGLKDASEVGFEFSAFLEVGMTHPELAELGFGSLMANEAKSIVPDANDWILHLVSGSEDGDRCRIEICPMTRQQMEETFKSQKNIATFVQSPLWDTTLADHLDQIAGDCLYLRVTLSERSSIATHAIERNMRTAVERANAISSSAVSRLRGLQ
jgi:hypothetical protein